MRMCSVASFAGRGERRLSFLGVHFALLAGTLWGWPALGQLPVEPEGLPLVKRLFDTAASEPRLRCEVESVPPTRDAALRFSTGYVVDIPVAQVRDSETGLSTYVRVTPEGRQPVYLRQSGSLPETAESKAQVEISGRFFIGEGRYEVQVLVLDGQHRACQSAWQVRAERPGGEGDLKSGIPAGTVEAISAPVQLAPQVDSPARVARLTILLHAAPMVPAHSKMQADEVQRLVDSVATVMRGLPAQSLRLVAFNLDQRTVIFRRDGYKADQQRELVAAINRMKLGVVDYKTLQIEPISVLADLIQAELESPQPPDALIVLGPRSATSKDFPAAGSSKRSTPLFLLKLAMPKPPLRPNTQSTRGGERISGRIAGAESRGYGRSEDDLPLEKPDFGEMPDSIQRLIGRLKGETIPIQTPHDLANAIRRMDARIPRNAALPGETAAPLPVAGPEVSEVSSPATPSAETHVEASRPASPPASGPPSPVPTSPPAASTIADHPPIDNEAIPEEDPVSVLMQLRDQVVEHGERVPNHTCVENIKRDRYEPTAGRTTASCSALIEARNQGDAKGRLRLDTTDWLRLDVAFFSTREVYSWAGANKFEEADIDELVPTGAVGTGAFAGLVLSLFASRSPRFTFEGQTSIEGRRVFEYTFRVRQEQSGYRFRAKKKKWVITGYFGTLFVDPKTAELVRLVIRTEELPESTQACESVVTLDFGVVQLAGGDYLLPKVARQRFLGRQGTEDENTMTFAGCRQYQAESTLAFGERGAGGESSGGASELDLPAELTVSVELTTTVRIGQAAAGDRIQGRLTRPIRDAQQKILAGEGALVQGRLMRVETSYTPPLEHIIALRWEAVEIDGAMTPIRLVPKRRPVEPMTVSGPNSLKRRGMEIELPLRGEGRYAVVHITEDHPVLESGYQSEWLTAKP